MLSSAPSASDFTRRQALGVLGALALPWNRLLAQTASPPSAGVAGNPTTPAAPAVPARPHLPNFHGMMEWIARENGPRLSFLDPSWRSLETWKQAARPVFRQHLSYDPTPLQLAADVMRREERDGFMLEVVNIHATPAYSIPARVLVPSKRQGKLPAVVALHCHSGRYTWGHEKIVSSPADSEYLLEFRSVAYGRPWAEALVRRGYVVIVADAFYFGERRLRVEDLDDIDSIPVAGGAREAVAAARSQPPGSREWIGATNRVCGLYEHLTAKTIFAAGATWPGLHVWDDMRTVDYLATRAEVDPARIGCAGLSIGGLRAAHLIAADPRIKAASVTGWMTEFAHLLRNHASPHTWMAYIPGLYRSLDLPDAAALHAPGALLVQQCRRDPLYTASGMQAAVDKLTRIYAKAGIPERFRGTFYDEPPGFKPHNFRPHLQEETFAWLDKWL
ncbi:MAG: dienelactone hydrolase family protein [Opitutaceae bacterium]